MLPLFEERSIKQFKFRSVQVIKSVKVKVSHCK